ncbi:NAD(P)-dependent oxidoreductase [Lichenibacterium ramalinae]|uniref:NAD(P)-dependent oxidoreductase n=1 Tax=Lichenibacterium ramalinae TaxID=2316527 RepID=A0A4Q2RDT5_9HYPH|nr:NAD(P)-dependent oxidoreductase [Lichenibacterium ramalinae]RYB04149.1 NAD(P)-dependent oxidoreductase [Lichenibacterium ramalinae]
MDIGFIGLGSMGSAMAANLVKAGHDVRVWNRSPEAARAIAGATPVGAPRDAFRGDAVLTMLADDAAVRAVVLDSGVLPAAPKGLVHVMMATISIALVDDLAAAHRTAGVAYVAAPVFGRPPAAAAAQLNIVAAGDPEAIARVQPLLDVLGTRTWRLGDEPRRANAAKLAGNMMLALAIEAMAEATSLTEGYGVSSADFLDIVTNTVFASPAYKSYGANIAAGSYEPAGFKLRLGLKDVNLAIAAAAANGTVLPAADLVRHHFMAGIDQGLGEKDWSALAEVAHRRAGLAR